MDFEKKDIELIVKDVLRHYIEGLSRVYSVNSASEESCNDTRSYVENMDSLTEMDSFLLDEGLIKTYDIFKVKKSFLRKFGMMDYCFDIIKKNDGDIDVYIPSITLEHDADANLIGDIVGFMRYCGYNKSREVHRNGKIILVFEPMFGNKVTEYVKDNFKVLYHASPKIVLDKIKKNGLTPRSKNAIFMYPDRVYCMKGISDKNLTPFQQRLVNGLKLTRKKDPDNPEENNEYVVITIDVSKLPDYTEFYSDPMSKESVFTYDTIPPQSFLKIEDI